LDREEGVGEALRAALPFESLVTLREEKRSDDILFLGEGQPASFLIVGLHCPPSRIAC
jgi:hypothetical protein